MSYTKEVAQKVRKMREFKGYSQEYLAAQLELSQRQYQRMESGTQEMHLSRLEEICKVLEVAPAEILGIDEKYIIENCTNSGFGHGFTINNLPEQLLAQYQAQIKQLQEEVIFLRTLVGEKPH
jgi:transcriptional regulator with XRE-family HTH domain